MPSGRSIAIYDRAFGKCFRADQGEAPRLSQLGKDRKTLAQYNRNDRRFVLVNQVMGDEAASERRHRHRRTSAFRPLPSIGDLLDEITARHIGLLQLSAPG